MQSGNASKRRLSPGQCTKRFKKVHTIYMQISYGEFTLGSLYCVFERMMYSKRCLLSLMYVS